MKVLTLGEFRAWTKHLPDTVPIAFHSYDKGCCLGAYDKDADCWIYEKDSDIVVVINPGESYDSRRPKKEEAE